MQKTASVTSVASVDRETRETRETQEHRRAGSSHATKAADTGQKGQNSTPSGILSVLSQMQTRSATGQAPRYRTGETRQSSTHEPRCEHAGKTRLRKTTAKPSVFGSQTLRKIFLRVSQNTPAAVTLRFDPACTPSREQHEPGIRRTSYVHWPRHDAARHAQRRTHTRTTHWPRRSRPRSACHTFRQR